MLKMTMYELSRLGMRMVLQRHDGFYHEVPEGWDDWAAYKAVIEKEWIIDDRAIAFPAEYETING